MAYSMSFNGIDMSGSTYGLTVRKASYPLSPEAVIPSISIPYHSGQFTSERWSQARQLSIPCVVVGTSASNLLTKLDAIALLLNEKTDKKLILDWQSDRYYLARLSSIEREHVGALAASLTLNFLVPDGHAYAASLTTQTEAPFTTAVAFDVPDSAALLAGTQYCEPIINVRPDPAVTVSATIIIAVSPCGFSIQTTADFVGGTNSWFRVHSGLKKWQTGTGSGAGTVLPTTWTDAMTYVSGTFPILTPGASNTITITVTGTTAADNRCVVQYRPRYL